MSYYLSTHIPLVTKHWTSYGLQAWEVIQFTPGSDEISPQYSAQAILTFESVEQIQKATASEEGKLLSDDVANFSNVSPVFMVGEMVGSL